MSAAVQPAAAAGFRSTLGSEFWVNFDANYDTTGTPTIYLSGAQNANVTLTWPDQTTETATVVAGSVTTVSATAKIATASKFTSTADGISQTAVKIVSDAAISVYLLNQRTATTDASQAYPTEYQGYEYRVLSSNRAAARFSVIANEPGTTVITVVPKVTLGSRAAGVAYTETLQQGDVYSLLSTADMRGTLVTSDKKITVSSSNTCVQLGRGACDHITEFIPPVTTWGKSFVVPASTNTLYQDRIAIMASQDNTVVTIDGTPTTLMLAGDLSDGFNSAVGATTIVTSDKPILVMQFVDGGAFSDGTNTASGDPAMVVITPVVQYLNDVAITTPATGFLVNTATLIVPVADVSTITFDGATLPSGAFGSTVTVGAASFKVAYVNLTLGTHRITSTNGFGVLVYGYNSYDSYAYAGAGGLVDLVQNPGGVAQVGYVAANQIPASGSTATPTEVPQPAIQATPVFYNKVIPVGSTGTLRLFGEKLSGLKTLKIGNTLVEILSISENYIEIKLPELAIGNFEISTSGSGDAGSWSSTQDMVLRVTAVESTPEATNRVAKFTIPNFAPGSFVLTAAMKSKISTTVAKYSTMTTASCVGATSGPTVLKTDALLAKNRAKVVCEYIATITPRAVTATVGKPSIVLGGLARKVDVTVRY
jgi:hypothetical protein